MSLPTKLSMTLPITLLRRAVLCLPLLGLGCERPASPDQGVEPLQAGQVGGPSFVHSDPRLTVAHSGLRRFEFTPPTGAGLTYRERITTDGNGRFALEPVDASDVDNWSAFELVQRVREGFLFRYRDFLVRDRQLFGRNWRTIDRGETVTVAGRICQRYRVERTIGEPRAFELSVDAETGLVLASEELDSGGARIAAMVYETIQLEPDLRFVAWHVASNEERVLDPLRSVAEQIQVQPLEPRLLPVGYAPLEAATVRDGEGAQWLKLTYTDGVEPLFLFQGLDSLAHAGLGSSSSSVVVFQVGAATVIQGKVDAFDLMVIGKALKAELLDLIESGLP